MSARALLALGAAVLAVVTPGLAQSPVVERPVRTFPDFVGTWMLDKEASTGRLRMAPPPAVTLTIATTSTEITVTSVLDLPPGQPGREGKRMATNNPAPEVYRLNGAPTMQPEYPGGTEIEQTFTLVADAFALTKKRPGRNGSFTAVTDALSVDGDVLTLHRQLTSVNEKGEIYAMQEPLNSLRQTYVYRRASAAGRK